MSSKVKILLLASNPKNTNPLRLAEEFRDIKESIRNSIYRDFFEVHQGEAVRPKDLRRLVLGISPNIVHFSGHGENMGIFLENEKGRIHLVKGEVLEELFSLFSSINCIVLNSCYSASQANHLKKVVPYIIGMSKPIEDQLAIRFSAGFYDSLGASRNIEDSFKFGVNSINLWKSEEKYRSFSIESSKEIPNLDIPILIKGDIYREILDVNKLNKIKKKKANKYNLFFYMTILFSMISIFFLVKFHVSLDSYNNQVFRERWEKQYQSSYEELDTEIFKNMPSIIPKYFANNPDMDKGKLIMWVVNNKISSSKLAKTKIPQYVDFFTELLNSCKPENCDKVLSVYFRNKIPEFWGNYRCWVNKLRGNGYPATYGNVIEEYYESSEIHLSRRNDANKSRNVKVRNSIDLCPDSSLNVIE